MEFLCIFHFLLWPLSYLGAAPAWGFSMDTGTCHRGGSARCSAVPRAGLLVFGCSSGGVHVCRCGSVRGPSRSAFRVQPQRCHCAAPLFFTTGVRLWTNKLVLEYFHTEMLNGKNKKKENQQQIEFAAILRAAVYLKRPFPVLLGVNWGEMCPASAPPRGADLARPRGATHVACTARFRARDRPRPALGAPSPDGHVTARSQAAPPAARSANRNAPCESRSRRYAQ